jgi:MFS transporter, NNP family, nitrate/nitrite transporter
MSTNTTSILEPAEQIELRRFSTPQMRAFHLAWLSFFLCFFGWFAVAPLMTLVRGDLGLSQAQVADTVVASVAGTVFARLLVGWLCDRFGPRRLFAALLVVGSVPVMCMGLATSYETLLLARLAVGMVGASFVIAQFHTSLMFAPRCVGTANAVTAGWGNLGGGVAQFVMPALCAGLMALGVSTSNSWRLSMIFPGVAMILAGFAYYRFTRDTPSGDLRDIARDERVGSSTGKASFVQALSDYRVWLLFLAYAACFGVELTTYNVSALYFADEFGLGLTAAGLVAAAHGSLNLFARALGGVVGDRAGIRAGVRGRMLALAGLLVAEGACLVLFSRMRELGPAIAALLAFSLFVQMACGATFSVVPFVNRRALGAVSGIVGAGGNVGAVVAGLLFRRAPAATVLLELGVAVFAVGLLIALVRLRSESVATEQAPAGALPEPAE